MQTLAYKIDLSDFYLANMSGFTWFYIYNLVGTNLSNIYL